MKVQFYHVGGACFVLKVDEDLLISCDPALSPAGTEYHFKSFSSIRVKPPIYEQHLFDSINIWLITHSHADHIDEFGIRHIAAGSTVVAPKRAGALLNNHQDVLTADWNDKITFSKQGYTVEITAIPAYHGNNFIMRTIVGKVNGYFIRLSKGTVVRTVYVTSDTVYHPAILGIVSKLGPIDLLIPNLGEVSPDTFGGPLTMSVKMLKMLVDKLKPKMTIPIHIDDFSHYTTTRTLVLEMGFNIVEQGCWIQVF